MTFYVVLEQDGGCDYTIGCGTAVVDLQADDRKSALREVENLIAEDYAYDEQRVWNAYLVQFVENIPIGQIYARLDNEAEADLQEQGELEDRAEYERLKAKFGEE